MSEISFEVDGQEISAEQGDTILEACERAGIEIPTLCHYSNLNDVGACRICTVEIDGDNFETACTTPVQDGISVRTNTEELREHRRTLLELICAEENHYCMYCDSDGDCELQDLLKEYGVDHVRIPFSYKKYPVDSVSDHLVIDHNRCILCGRCIRTCEEVVANDTLDFGERGQDTKVVADLNQPIGESTCISCGSCLQVCPTGTILSKHSVYRGNTKECSSAETYCSECSSACGIEVFTRSGQLVQIKGTETDQPSGGQLCEKGRFGPLMEDRDRVEKAYVKRNGDTQEMDLEEALELAGKEMKEADSVSGMISGRLPSETLEGFDRFIEDYDGSFYIPGSDKLIAERDVLNSPKEPYADSLTDILQADEIFVFDTTIVDTHPILSSYIRRRAKEGASLFVFDDDQDRFSRYSSGSSIGELDLDNGEERMEKEDKSFVVIGKNIKEKGKLSEIYNFADRTDSEVISLHGFSNYKAKEFKQDKKEEADLLYLLSSDDKDIDEMLKAAKKAEFVIVQSSRASDLTKEADLVLPGLIWSERSGTIEDVDGNKKSLNRINKPRTEFDKEEELFERINGF